MNLALLIAMLTCLVLTAILCAAMIPVARAMGLVDQPGKRKVHESATPLAGGLALFVGFLLISVYSGIDNRFIQALLAGGTILFLTGLLDDLRDLPATIRFLAQIAACCIMVYHADVRLTDFGQLFWDATFPLGHLSALITVFAAMGVINAFNLIDGMDGLAGAVFVVAATGVSLFAAMAYQSQVFILSSLMLAAVLGFMAWNVPVPWRPKALCFLGDSGSLLLGFVLAWFFIALGNDQPRLGERAFMPMTAVWLIALPLVDTSTVIWIRWREGRSAFRADRGHLHHLFLAAGFRVGHTLLAMAALAIALAGMGVAFELTGAPEYLSFWVFLSFSFCYYFYVRSSWARGRFLGRPLAANRHSA